MAKSHNSPALLSSGVENWYWFTYIFLKKLPQHFREVSLPDIHFVPLIVCLDSV